MNEKMKSLLLLVFWFVVIYICIVVSTAIFSIITRFVLVQVNMFEELSGYFPRLLSIIVCIALVSLYFKYFMNEKFRIYALGDREFILHDSLVGFFGTIIVLTGVFVILTAGKWLIINAWLIKSRSFYEMIRPICLAFVTSLTAAVGEEVLFRGFFQKRLEQIFHNPFYAFWISASVFSLVHFFTSTANRGNPFLLFINILIAGILLSYLYYKTGSLILPISIHFTYDFFAEDFFNLSGKPVNPSLYGAITESVVPSYITGSDYGIETGFIGTLVWLLLLFLFTRYLHYRLKKKSKCI